MKEEVQWEQRADVLEAGDGGDADSKDKAKASLKQPRLIAYEATHPTPYNYPGLDAPLVPSGMFSP